MVSFPIVGDPVNAALVAWTATPWTLPSNLALCINANFVYVKVGYFFSGNLIIKLIRISNGDLLCMPIPGAYA